jgi:hypothetical protein
VFGHHHHSGVSDPHAADARSTRQKVAVMNIALFCISPAWGGLEINMYRLAKHLSERGHAVLLIVAPGTTLCRYAEKAGLAVETLAVKVKYVDLGAAYRLSGPPQAEKHFLL